PSLSEIENYDAILILGENISETGARMALSVRQAINNISSITNTINIKNWHSDAIKNYTQERKNLLFITNVDVTDLDDIATWCYYASLDDQARFGFMLANVIDNTAPKIVNISDKLVKKIHDIAHSLIHANKVLIISGTTTNKNIIKAAANIAIALKNKKISVGINFITNYANGLGLSLIKNQGSIEQALNLLKHKVADGLIILENDLYRYVLKNKLDNLLNNISTIIILDYKYNNVMKKANIIIPTTSNIESSGTVINYEGRIQKFFKPYDRYLNNKSYLLDSWYWLHNIDSKYLNKPIKWKNINDVTKSLTKHISKLNNIHIIDTNNNNSEKQELFTNIPRNCGYNALDNLCTKNSKCFFTDEELFNKQKNINNYEIKYNDINMNVLDNEYHNYINTSIKIFDKKIGNMHYFNYINNNKKSNKWLIIPYWHMFGSEETSQKIKVIKQVTSLAYIIISYEDAKILSIKNNSLVTFTCMGNNFTLPAKLSDKLCSGNIGLPIGLPGIPICLSGLTINNIKK
ncbi:MAG: molybdopterin-dependent oxidoreductase, partial [Candidatus Lightella neohaematopini]|nr:molybdopterin-dependent oxidoreductase [Candidatus Lightella neohaematopini]